MKLRRGSAFASALCFIAALGCGDVSGSSTSVLSIQFDTLAAPSVVVGDTLRDTTGVVIVPTVHAFNFKGEEITPVAARFQSPVDVEQFAPRGQTVLAFGMIRPYKGLGDSTQDIPS